LFKAGIINEGRGKREEGRRKRDESCLILIDMAGITHAGLKILWLRLTEPEFLHQYLSD
jgi:hypothetical protein